VATQSVANTAALIFNGSSALDFQEIRANVIRIPEVSHSIREAQSIWDAIHPSPFDLLNFITSDDQMFMSNIKLKNFASAVVQVGLLRRYLRSNELPEYIIGTINGDSPLKVALKQISFVEMVAESEALPKERLTLISNGGPLLAGVRLEEYVVYQRTAGDTYKRLEFETRDVKKMIEGLIANQNVSKLVFVGPGTFNSTTTGSAQIVESIDLDPSLSWFWAGIRQANQAAV
jgi:hypothetical protein